MRNSLRTPSTIALTRDPGLGRSAPAPLRRLAALVLLVIGTLGCEQVETMYVDPPIDLGSAPLVTAIPGDPLVGLFLFSDGDYSRIEAGGDLPVILRLQGGYWAHPIVRTVGIGTPAIVACSLTLESTGEVLSTGEPKMRFYLSDSGEWLEVVGLLPVRNTREGAPDAIQWVFGETADLSCTVTDGQNRSAGSSVRVVIVDS